MDPGELQDVAKYLDLKAEELQEAFVRFRAKADGEAISDAYGFIPESDEATQAANKAYSEGVKALSGLARYLGAVADGLRTTASRTQGMDVTTSTLFHGGGSQ